MKKIEIKPERHVRAYAPLKRDTATREIPCGWDTETDGLNGALLALTWSAPDTTGFIEPDGLEAFYQCLESHPYPHVWYAHNAQYDWRYILPDLLKRYQCTFLNRTESEIFAIRCQIDENHYIDMRDSMALFPSSLDDFASIFAPDTPKLKLDLSKIRFNPNDSYHRQYALRDAEALRLSLERFRATFHNLYGCYPGFTTAGTSLKAWRKTLNKKYYCLPRKTEEYLRLGYYGGIVFLTDDNIHEGAITYDINSSYPAAMVQYGVPYGRAVSTNRLRFDVPGFWDLEIDAGTVRIPILGSKDSRGNTYWPSGIFRSIVSSCELSFALEHGYKIRKVFGGVVFRDIIKPFDNFVSHCRQLRFDNPDSKSPLNIVAKLMQNSLYGKFASKFIRKEIFAADPFGEDCRDYEYLEGMNLWAKLIDDYQTNRMIHWSAWITAQARVNLLRAAYAGGVDHVIYGDTDSLTVAPGFVMPDHMIGSEYGQFKVEKRWVLFRAHAPKVYAGILEDGSIVGKAKGIPRKIITDANYRQIIDNSRFSVDYESVPKLTSILKGQETFGTGTVKHVRSLTNLEFSRNWERHHDGKISARPMEKKAAS